MPLFGSKKPDVEKLLLKSDVKGLLKALTYRDDFKVRESAAAALGEIGGEHSFDGLVAALVDSEESVRKAAALSLGKSDTPEAINALSVAGSADGVLFILNNSKLPERRVKAAHVLGKMGDEHAADGLINALKHEDSSVRFAARDALSTIGGNLVADKLRVTLKDPDPYVRMNAAAALGKIGGNRAVDDLIGVLQDSDWVVRKSASEALSNIDGGYTLNRLIATLKIEKSPSVRNGIIEILSKIGLSTATEDIWDLMKASTSIQETSFLIESLGAEYAVDAVIATLRKDPLSFKNKNALYEAAGAVLSKNGDSAIKKLKAFTIDSNAAVSEFALEVTSVIQRNVMKYNAAIEDFAIESMFSIKDWDAGKRETAEKRIRGGSEPLARLYSALWDRKINVAYELVKLYPDLLKTVTNYANRQNDPYEGPALVSTTYESAKRVLEKINQHHEDLPKAPKKN
ncbi:MAG: HEAT repeat domain-containing protein [Candidatus Bathyarchaeota archaeon]|nr:HEAT repeat domain-containing protein [Candidatus Bathyarchaeota archaeon]